MALSVFAVAVVSALTGCAAEAEPTPTSTTPVASASATPTSTPTPTTVPVVLVPDGSADDNVPLFRKVVKKVWASDDKVHGRAYVDALVKAGFSKKAMQVTEDLSTVGNAAESLQFSVLWHDDQCLIGQVGPETGAPVVEVMPELGDGRCLLGKTRTIDW